MRPPSALTLTLGNPACAPLSVCLAAYLCWLCYMDVNGGTACMALAGLWLMDRAFAASEICRRYRAWQRDWMAVAGIATRRPVIPIWLRQTIGIGVFSGMYVWFANQSDPVCQWLALGPGLAALLLALKPLLWALKRLMRGLRRKPAQYRGPVLIVVPSPIQAVPSLGDAYRSVPDYCQQVMQDRR